MGVQRKIFRNDHFAEESFQTMNELRKEEKLCDVVLKVNKREVAALLRGRLRARTQFGHQVGFHGTHAIARMDLL